MKKLLSLLLLAAASLGTFLALGGCGGSSRAASGDIMDDCVDGGVTRRHSYDAPKVILSTEIAALDADFFLYDGDGGGTGWFFSVRREGDAFLLSVRKRGKAAVEKPVGRDFLGEVHAAIMKHGLPRLNGFDEVTSGLPYEYAPCSLSVDYASGERLYFHMDGDPEADWARELRNLFLKALGER
ncbi:MAG: hypothetical protein IKY97_05010 [Mailhella sp.]|nr:hypothetical protein [Mailhella sp.]